MKLKMELPSDIEALYAEARAKGVSLERYIVDYLVYTACTKNERSRAAKAEIRQLRLPQLRGTIVGSLRRQDIYGEQGDS